MKNLEKLLFDEAVYIEKYLRFAKRELMKEDYELQEQVLRYEEYAKEEPTEENLKYLNLTKKLFIHNKKELEDLEILMKKIEDASYKEFGLKE